MGKKKLINKLSRTVILYLDLSSDLLFYPGYRGSSNSPLELRALA